MLIRKRVGKSSVGSNPGDFGDNQWQSSKTRYHRRDGTSDGHTTPCQQSTGLNAPNVANCVCRTISAQPAGITKADWLLNRSRTTSTTPNDRRSRVTQAMPTGEHTGTDSSHPATISIDAMGGDRGPNAVLGGMVKAARKHPAIRFVVHGNRDVLQPRIQKRRWLRDRCDVRHSDEVVEMTSVPSKVARKGKKTSMWAAIQAVREGEADAAVSSGNTGALMALSMMCLKRAPGTKRPAIACHWPSRNESGFTVLLDVGADIKADEHDLLHYAILGADYARFGFGLTRPRVGLLNIGKENFKGRPEIRLANDLIIECSEERGFEYVGYVEGSDIPGGTADVFVTDGYTGNAMIKSVEGTATLIRDFLREAFNHTILSRIGALFAITSLRRLAKRIDPRWVNGGVFLGLNGTVVKSHGSADAVGFAAAIDLAVRLSRARGLQKLTASGVVGGQGAGA